MSEDGIHLDLTWAEESIYQTTGIRPRVYRSPFGAVTEVLKKVLQLRGYQHVGWDLDSKDYSQDEKGVLENLSMVRDNQTVLFHTWPDSTVAALPTVLDFLEGKS
jgi:peptidoglycan/xylan/chitin deacetylase (PgdA/CDA1 family)